MPRRLYCDVCGRGLELEEVIEVPALQGLSWLVCRECVNSNRDSYQEYLEVLKHMRDSAYKYPNNFLVSPMITGLDLWVLILENILAITNESETVS